MDSLVSTWYNIPSYLISALDMRLILLPMKGVPELIVELQRTPSCQAQPVRTSATAHAPLELVAPFADSDLIFHHRAEMDVEAIAKTFVDSYYQMFDTNRSGLGALYVSSSS